MEARHIFLYRQNLKMSFTKKTSHYTTFWLMLLRVLKNITETRFQKNTFILLLTTSLQTSQQSLIYQIFLIVV